MKEIPKWITALEDEELSFIKRFVLSSGSLKEMAQIYEVTYPTMRIRLDRVIEKMKDSEVQEEETFVKLVKQMVIEEKLDFDAAAVLIREYRNEKEEG